MVFEPNFKRVTSSTRKSIGITQSVVELKLPTNDGNISAIYSVGATSSIVGAEMSGNMVNFTGLVDFQAVYQSDKVSAIDYAAEFKDRFESDRDLSGELILNSTVVDVTSSIVSGGIRVVAIIETTIDIIESIERNVLVSVESPKACSAIKDISYSTYLGKAFEKFDVSGEIELSSATAVYMVTPNIRLKNVEAKDNYIAVSGVMGLDICYESGEGVESVRSAYREIEFDWEVAYDGIDSDALVQSSIVIISNETKVSSVVSEDGLILSINLPVEFSGYVFESTTITIIEDLYLESNYLSITAENAETVTDLKAMSFKDNISGSAEIMEQSPFIDEILAVCTSNIVIAKSVVMDGKLTVEGVATATVLYYTKETGSITPVSIDMPFSVEEKSDSEESSVVTVALIDLSAKSRRGKEIEVSAELVVYSDLYNTNSNTIISEVVVGEEKVKDDCSLYIYIVKPNETIWDIAKEMNVSVDLILEQNPNLELPVKPGDRLVIYKSRMEEY